jgi:DNA polymerase III epsilon subunit-like protein
MREIRTLVYFGIEATGLKNSGKHRITKISLVAVNRQDVLGLQVKIGDKLNNCKSEEELVQCESLVLRVINKISLCVYPIDNYNLTGQAIFDKNTGELIKNFLARLPPPVCLVAHNGSIYDFPLLKAEMQKAGIELGSQILCADSYVGLMEIFKKREEDARKENINGCQEKKTIKKKGTPISFSLINLHRHFMGCHPSQSHGAEADCLALLITMDVLGDEWLDWVENNCYWFTDYVGNLWPGKMKSFFSS